MVLLQQWNQNGNEGTREQNKGENKYWEKQEKCIEDY